MFGKGKKIIVLAIFCFVIGGAVLMIVSQYKWSSQLNKAILNNDKQKVEELLQEKRKKVNFVGKTPDHYGVARPLELACYCPSSHEIVQLLIDGGASVNPKVDYYGVVWYTDIDDYEKIKILIKTGVKPIIKPSAKEDLLSVIAGTDITYGEIWGINQDKWEEKIINTYKLIYENAEDFDKKEELALSIRIAKQAKNKKLVEYLNQEFEKLG